jgi:hypothetical protein
MHMTKSSIARVCGVAAALFLFGCGSSGSSSDPADAFAGNWTFDSGSIDGVCAGAALSPVELTGDPLTINKVDATHLTVTLTGNGLMCNVNFSVSGSTATATGMPTCAFPVTLAGATMTVTANITQWTLNTSSSGSLSMMMAGTASICSATGTGTASRIGSDGGAGG